MLREQFINLICTSSRDSDNFGDALWRSQKEILTRMICNVKLTSAENVDKPYRCPSPGAFLIKTAPIRIQIPSQIQWREFQRMSNGFQNGIIFPGRNRPCGAINFVVFNDRNSKKSERIKSCASNTAITVSNLYQSCIGLNACEVTQ